MRKSKIAVCLLCAVLALSMLLSMTGCSGSKDDNKSYTYHDYAAATPNTWNPHEWETNEDSYIMNYTTMGFYDFIMNDEKTGYTIIPEMAAAFPVDVTKDYAGNATYGVPADATSGYAFKIALNEKATWEDGTKITAEDYIYSMQQMLNPEMKNYRASGYYSGTMTIANAETYYKQNAPIYSPIADISGDAPVYADVADTELYFSLTDIIPFFGENSAADYYNAGYDSYFAAADGTNLFTKYKTGEAYIKLDDAAKADLNTIAAAFDDTRPEAYKEFCFYVTGRTDSCDWETVGLKKTGDYEITLILSKQITDFYLKYNLSSNWIVKKDIYEANKKQVGSLTKTTYGTSVETYSSFGPYKLVEFQEGKIMKMAKNDNWYGYSDGSHKNQFQTTAIECQVVEKQETALQLFLQGALDNVAMVAENMATYRNSDYIMFTPETYTSKFSMNKDKASLKSRETAGVNKSILAYADFREAVSLSIDRTAFAAQCTATHVPGYGLINYMYVSDPETGALYRDSAAAQETLKKLYGVDDVSKITGYDVEKAKTLFTQAYNDALTAGDIKATDKVELEFHVYKSDDSYVKIVNFVDSAVKAATVGTPLEGRVTIKMVANEDYYDQMQEGKIDMIISTWGGAQMDPFSMMECYCTEKAFEYGFDYAKETLTINVDGQDLTKTYAEWYTALCDTDYAAASIETRTNILAAMEYGILSQYTCPPIYYRTAASLDSRRVVNASETYIQLVGFGGIRFMTYNMDDTAWTEYCTSVNNQLTY